MKKIISILSLIALMSACSVYNNVHTDYDKSVDFKTYKTFAWLPDSGAASKDPGFKNTPFDNDIIRNNAKNYVNHGLTDRGFHVSSEAPDLVLQLVLLNEKKEEIVHMLSPPYPYYYYNRYYYPYYYPQFDYFTYYGWGYMPTFYFGKFKQIYIKGSITINMYDRRSKKLIWTGSAEGNIYDPDYVRYSVHPAVRSILRKFPVKPLPKDYFMG